MFSREMELELDERLLHYQEKQERKIDAREGLHPRPVSWLIGQNRLRFDESMSYMDANGRESGFTGWRNAYHRRFRVGGGPRH